MKIIAASISQTANVLRHGELAFGVTPNPRPNIAASTSGAGLAGRQIFCFA